MCEDTWHKIFVKFATKNSPFLDSIIVIGEKNVQKEKNRLFDTLGEGSWFPRGKYIILSISSSPEVEFPFLQKFFFLRS